jgi:hypothetical protein
MMFLQLFRLREIDSAEQRLAVIDLRMLFYDRPEALRRGCLAAGD